MATGPTESENFAGQQAGKLHRVLGRWDIIFFTVSGVIGVDTVAYAAQTGYQIITWTLLSAVLYLLPYGLITAELSAAYPKEGGLYFWVRRAFGPYIGSVVSFLYWISNPIWMGSLAVTAVGTLSDAFSWHLSPLAGMLLALAVIWLTTVIEITYLRVAKWAVNIGAVIKFALLVLLGVGALAVVLTRGSADPMTLAKFVPDFSTTLVLMPVLIFNWVGFELQSNAAEEIQNPRRNVPRSILVSGIMAALGYSLGIFGVLVTTPANRLSAITGLLGAFQGIFAGRALIAVLAIAIAIGYIISGTTWLIGVDRSFATSGWDASIPRFFGHFHNRFGTPDRVAVLSGLVPTALILVNYFTYHGAGLSGTYNTLLNAAFVAALFPYLFMLPAVIILRRRDPGIERPYVVPGGQVGLWTAVILSLAFSFPAVFANFIPTSLTGVTAASATELVYYFLGEIAVASLFYLWARRERLTGANAASAAD